MVYLCFVDMHLARMDCCNKSLYQSVKNKESDTYIEAQNGMVIGLDANKDGTYQDKYIYDMETGLYKKH